MIAQWEKFLRVYNMLAGTDFGMDLKQGAYDEMIRSLGTYISTVYEPSAWQSTTLMFGDAHIVMRHFVGTPYEEKVGNFLAQLRRAFDDSLDVEVNEYFSSTEELTAREKQICREYYGHLSALHRAMKQSAFPAVGDTRLEVTDRASIRGYHEVLREFNAYMNTLAADQGLYTLIREFDRTFRQLAANKKPVQVLFDV